jgi:DNA-directed RNA polymerase subunit M/transcription elongation factor TFIIS
MFLVNSETQVKSSINSKDNPDVNDMSLEEIREEIKEQSRILADTSKKIKDHLPQHGGKKSATCHKCINQEMSFRITRKRLIALRSRLLELKSENNS